MGWGLVVVAIISAIASAYAAYEQGQTQKKIADYNADIAEDEAKNAETRAKWEEQQYKNRMKRLMSSQMTLYSKAGVSMEGTPLIVSEESAGEAAVDAFAIRHGGRVESSRLLSEASLSRMKGRSYARAGTIRAGQSLLSGAERYTRLN